jgi:predicted glycoside hydrolase/deacetylase ChbG (UPF0249 family)
MKIILNADDLGYDLPLNQKVFDLMEDHKLTSSTIIVNAPAFDDACRYIPKNKHCSFGIHLNLTEFKPVSKNKFLYPILDSNGNFSKDIRLINMNRNLMYAVFDEWSAQVEKLIKEGINISHIDSHGHIHTDPRLFYVLKKIQKKYSLNRVRISQNIYSLENKISSLLVFKKKLWNFALHYFPRTITTNYFGDIEDFIKLPKKDISRIDTVELMTHPGGYKATDENILRSNLQEKSKTPVSYISYNEL